MSKDEYVETKEQVLDQRTRLIVFKMTNSILKEVNGCISTGKEASVYHAVSTDKETFTQSTNPKEQEQRERIAYFPEVAIKIFKTSLNEFKNRSMYMEGDHRFSKFSKQNPRKMIKLWAEKEMRNLKRVNKFDSIKAPVPVLLREHILLMQFIGEDGKHAPQLKDVNLSSKNFKRAYLQVVKMMRDLFQLCDLVHSDLSEFNLLYFKKNVYIIDFAAG
jgi:RIO kinase 1